MDDLDEKIDTTLKNMKNKLESETLSEDFKEGLIQKLEEKGQNINQKTNPFKYKKWILATICCLLIIAGGSLASDFENTILKHFSNIDKVTQTAIENGNIEYLNNEYVIDQGIAIKADYLIQDEKYTYVAIEVIADDYDKIALDKFKILDIDGETIFDNMILNKKMNLKVFYSYDAGKTIFIGMDKFERIKDVDTIIINGFYLINGNIKHKIMGNWKLNL